LFSYASSGKKINYSQKTEKNLANNEKIENKTLIINFKNLKTLLLNNNKELIKYKSQVSQAKASLKSKKSTWYPKLNISSNSLPSLTTGEIDNKLSTDSATNQLKYELNGSITWNIIEPSRKLEINIAEDSLKNSEYQYAFIKNELFLKAAKLYFSIQRSIQDIKTTQQAIEISKTSLKEAKNRYESGIGNKLDLLEAKTQLGREKIALVKINGKLRFNKNELAKILNLKENYIIETEEVPRILGFWHLNKKDSLSEGFKNRYDLKIAAKEIDINAKKAKSIISGKKPKLTLYNNYSISTSKGETSVSEPNFDNVINTNNNTLGIKFNLDLYDGGLIKQEFKRIMERQNELVADLQLKKLEIETSIINALSDLKISKENIIISYQQVKSAKESLNISMKRLDAGLTTQREIVNLQGDVTEAESNYINAITEYNTSIETLIRSTGIRNYNSCHISSKEDIFVNFAKKNELLNCNLTEHEMNI